MTINKVLFVALCLYHGEDAQTPPGLRPSPCLATGVPRSLVCVRLRQGTRDAAHASGSWAASGSGRARLAAGHALRPRHCAGTG